MGVPAGAQMSMPSWSRRTPRIGCTRIPKPDTIGQPGNGNDRAGRWGGGAPIGPVGLGLALGAVVAEPGRVVAGGRAVGAGRVVAGAALSADGSWPADGWPAAGSWPAVGSWPRAGGRGRRGRGPGRRHGGRAGRGGGRGGRPGAKRRGRRRGRNGGGIGGLRAQEGCDARGLGSQAVDPGLVRGLDGLDPRDELALAGHLDRGLVARRGLGRPVGLEPGLAVGQPGPGGLGTAAGGGGLLLQATEAFLVLGQAFDPDPCTSPTMPA